MHLQPHRFAVRAGAVERPGPGYEGKVVDLEHERDYIRARGVGEDGIDRGNSRSFAAVCRVIIGLYKRVLS